MSNVQQMHTCIKVALQHKFHKTSYFFKSLICSLVHVIPSELDKYEKNIIKLCLEVIVILIWIDLDKLMIINR